MPLPGMGGFGEAVTRPGDSSHCAADCLFVTIHPAKGWAAVSAFCLLSGELAFTAAENCLVEFPSHRIQ